MRVALGAVVLTLVIVMFPSAGRANHERFIVGTMRNVDPSGDVATSTSGACVPSHDREKLDCYFTSFGLWRSKKDEDLRKDFSEAVQGLNKDPNKVVAEMKKSLCDDKKMTQPAPIRLKYDVSASIFFGAVQTFCKQPSRESAVAFFRSMGEMEAKKCNCVVTDWHSTLVRQLDRWVENSGPNGLCGVIKVFTLVPQDPKKMKDSTGPILWTLYEKTVTTHGADDKVCGKGLFRIEEGSMTVSWNGPSKSLDCREIEFNSALEGMSDPIKK